MWVVYYLAEKCSWIYCQELEWLIDDVQGRTKVRQCPCVWKICRSACERMSACVSVRVLEVGIAYIHRQRNKVPWVHAILKLKTITMRFVVEVYCAGKQNKQWRETAVPTICLFCKLLWVKVLCTHVDCENCSVSDIYTQTAIDLFSAYSCDDHTHTCTSKHVHTLSLDSPVYTISHEDKHACTNRASLRIALYRSSETQTAIRLNPIYTRQSQGCACKHACTHTHTHTHSFYENCIVSSSYTQMAISLDPAYTSRSWGWGRACTHTQTQLL